MVAALSLSMILAQQEPDPNRLPIGEKGDVQAVVGKIIDTKTGKEVGVDAIAAAADGKRWVFLGENHATAAHQNLQAEIIKALVARGRTVSVGLEMITRPKQAVLDRWSKGELSEETFITEVDWKGQWGFDYSFYRPVFEAVKASKLPLYALNVPRDWVRVVGREGYEALTAEQKAQLPAEFELNNQEHRAIFGALMGGHPPTGTRGENIYKAQVLWDVGMADTALKLRPNNPQQVTVVIAGIGHTMYGQGINWRIQKRTGETGINVSMIQSEEDPMVAKGLGDYVFVSKPVK